MLGYVADPLTVDVDFPRILEAGQIPCALENWVCCRTSLRRDAACRGVCHRKILRAPWPAMSRCGIGKRSFVRTGNKWNDALSQEGIENQEPGDALFFGFNPIIRLKERPSRTGWSSGKITPPTA